MVYVYQCFFYLRGHKDTNYLAGLSLVRYIKYFFTSLRHALLFWLLALRSKVAVGASKIGYDYKNKDC